MPYTITFNSAEHLIEAKIYGAFDMGELERFAKEVSKISFEKKCYRQLSDFREARVVFSTIQIYDLPQKIKTLLDSERVDVRFLQRAIVIANDVDDFKFFETVTLNSAQHVKLFYDVEAARQWLLADQ